MCYWRRGVQCRRSTLVLVTSYIVRASGATAAVAGTVPHTARRQTDRHTDARCSCLIFSVLRATIASVHVQCRISSRVVERAVFKLPWNQRATTDVTQPFVVVGEFVMFVYRLKSKRFLSQLVCCLQVPLPTHVSITSAQFAVSWGKVVLNYRILYSLSTANRRRTPMPSPGRCIFEQVIFDHVVWWPWSLTFWPQNLVTSFSSREVH